MKWKVCKKESKKHKKNAIFANFDNENDDENKKKSSTRNHLIHLGEKYMIDLKNFKNLNMMLESGSYGSLYLV